MKRFWIGITVLAVLLASGWAVAFFMERCHTPISKELAQASQIAVSGQLKQAAKIADNAKTQWLSCRDFTAAFADHDVLEEMDALFAEIDVYAVTGNSISFSAACAHLSELAKAVAESHHPKWQNLL